MENRSVKKWGFEVEQGQGQELRFSSGPTTAITVGQAITILRENLDKNDSRPTIPLGHGDPSPFPSFRTANVAEDAIIDALRSAKYNCYAPNFGIPSARKAIADHLNRDLPYKLTQDDVYVTLGCKKAIQIILSALFRPGANILLPRPGWPFYESFTGQMNFEARFFDLLPEKGWEVDLDAIEALADENSVAMVIVNPGNPCGNVFTYQHMQKIVETARKHRMMIIADEAYEHLTFGSTPFVRMGVFGSMVPIITVGSLSKRWLAPGWRLGWLVICDPNGIFQKSGLIDSIKNYANFYCDHAATFIQGAVPQILEKTGEIFFSKITGILRVAADICNDRIKEIPCLTCPNKPQGSMFVMVRLDPSLLEDINDDMEFCVKLAKEESVIVLPGNVVGMKDWLRISFAVEHSALEDGLGRMKAFCNRHSRKQ